MPAKKRVLVCGASGFIGRNLFEYFDYSKDQRNFEAYGTYFKNKPNSFRSNLFQCDLRDRSQAILATKDMDIVINCAAMTDGMGVYDPATYIPPNIQINQNLIEAAFINRIRNFIFLSCTVMYPSSECPLKEYEHDPDNVHPKYRLPALMKISAENLCQIYAGLGTTKYTAIRHTNIYGPNDKFDLVRGHVLSATVEKVMRADKEITIWGPGTESRDFLHINDLISFINRAIELQENNFEIFNVGYGKTHSINELVQKIIFCSKKNLDIIHDLEKPTINTQMNINIEKAKNLLNWKADIGLSEGLVMTLDWYRSRLQ